MQIRVRLGQCSPAMPSASVSTATAVKPGVFSNLRKAKRKPFISGFTIYDLRDGKSQIPSSKLQINPKLQIPTIESTALAGVWSFGIGASLGFGAWWLELSFIAECLHRLHAGGTVRRKVTGQKGDCSEER